MKLARRKSPAVRPDGSLKTFNDLSFVLVASYCEGRARKVATVLIIEDEFLVRDFLQNELEEAGYDLILAHNADAAMAILETRADIHLVFTDLARWTD